MPVDEKGKQIRETKKEKKGTTYDVRHVTVYIDNANIINKSYGNHNSANSNTATRTFSNIVNTERKWILIGLAVILWKWKAKISPFANASPHKILYVLNIFDSLLWLQVKASPLIHCGEMQFVWVLILILATTTTTILIQRCNSYHSLFLLELFFFLLLSLHLFITLTLLLKVEMQCNSGSIVHFRKY